jgi:hypothetical protein
VAVRTERHVSLFRALLESHWLTSKNRLVREMGKQGVWALWIGVIALSLFVFLPAIAGFGTLGYLMGARIDSPVTVPLAGFGLGCLSLFGGIGGGILGGSKGLTWEAYRGYPLRLGTLFLAELIAGLADLLPAMLSFCVLSLALGCAIAKPALIPLLALSAIELIGTLLVMQLLIGSLAAALVKRLRVALMIMGGLVWGASMLTSSLAPVKRGDKSQPRPQMRVETKEQIRELGRVAQRVLAPLPSTVAVQSLQDANQGRIGRALIAHCYPLGLLLALAAISATLLRRESEPKSHSENLKGPEKLWSFRHPAGGVARLQWRSLMASQLGKFGLVMPLMTIVLIKGPLAQFAGHSAWSAPASFAYLSLVGSQMLFNQFGLDGHGIKGLLLLPISSRDLLKGKLLGLASYLGLQAAMLLVLLAILQRPRPDELVSALMLFGCCVLVMASIGQWTSAWMPRPIPRDSIKNNSMPFVLVLVSMGASLGCSIVFGGTFFLCSSFAPKALMPVMVVLFATTAFLHRAILPITSRYLETRREKLVEVLG